MTISAVTHALPPFEIRMRPIAHLPETDKSATANTESGLDPQKKVIEYSLIDNWPGARFPRLSPVPRLDQDATAPLTATDPTLGVYQRQQAPWLAGHQDIQALPDAALEERRAFYLKSVIDDSEGALNGLFDDYHDFRQPLFFTHPALSKKHFGFTLGPDQQIRVTDPDNVLTAAESSYLSEKLNARERLKAHVYTHAKTVMERVDHLTEMFGDRYAVTLENYHKIIDYGQVFTRNTIGNFMDTWAWQVHRYADEREHTGHGSPSRINISA